MLRSPRVNFKIKAQVLLVSALCCLNNIMLFINEKRIAREVIPEVFVPKDHIVRAVPKKGYIIRPAKSKRAL